MIDYLSPLLLSLFIRLLDAAGADGIAKVVDKFLALHPTYAKRQIELKIYELATKEKPSDSSKVVWQIKPEYAKYLKMENFLDKVEGGAQTAMDVASGGPAAVKTNPSSKKEGSTAKKPKSDSNVAEKEDLQSAKKATPKRKLYEEEEDQSRAATSVAKEPKKFRAPFGHFVRERQADVEKELGGAAAVSLFYCHCYCRCY